MKLLFLIIAFPWFSFCQDLCEIPKQSATSILECVFAENEFSNQKKISIRNNFVTSCFRFNKFGDSRIQFLSEHKLYEKGIDNYYSIVKIQYFGNSAIVFLTQRKSNLFASFNIIKEGQQWILSKKNVVNGKLKVDDFLYSAIISKNKN